MHRRNKTEATGKADNVASQSSMAGVAKVGGGQDGPQLIVSSGNPKEDKPERKGDFPLDHILPVFNLNSKSKKESSFIPTLKVKQKDNGLTGHKEKFSHN